MAFKRSRVRFPSAPPKKSDICVALKIITSSVVTQFVSVGGIDHEAWNGFNVSTWRGLVGHIIVGGIVFESQCQELRIRAEHKNN